MTENNVSQLFCGGFRINRLNNGNIDLNNLPEYVIFTDDKNERIYKNGISDSYKVDIKNGYKLHVCKNQFIDFKNFMSEEKSLRVHFKLVGIGEHSNCSCGACGFKWHFEEDTCTCEETNSIDPGNQSCRIQ